MSLAVVCGFGCGSSPDSNQPGPLTGGAAGGAAAAGGSAGTAGFANQYVDAINTVRAAVTQPANYTGTWAPLPKVTWSDSVAASAQAWANNLATTQNCNLVHENQDTYGENLAMGTNLTPQQAVAMWAGEKNLYTWSATYSMADFDAGSGHYTQLVWRTSVQVGCGRATCGSNTVVICCRFSPPGNYIGRAVF
jgi:pathogenesis-related protein 1